MKRAGAILGLLTIFLIHCRSDVRQMDPSVDVDADSDSDSDSDIDILPDGDEDVSTECDYGFEDCNDNLSDGCEINILEDVLNCGSCGNDCHNLPNVLEAFCNSGSCVIDSCRGEYSDMDGYPSNGCEHTCEITSGAHEIPDGIDNDCDGLIDEGTDSLIFYASLDDFTDGVVLDYSANENHGTANGELAYAPESIFGEAIEFDGRSFVEFENTGILNGLSQGTWMLWVNVSAEGIERLMMPLSKEGCYQFAWWPDGNYFNFGYGNSTDSWATFLRSEEALETNRWYFLAATYDGSEFRFYIDGDQVASRLSSGEISEFPTNLFVGADRRGSREFVGSIDEIAIYNRPWLEVEIDNYLNLLASE